MGLRNGISLEIRKKHIRIGNKFDCVEGTILRTFSRNSSFRNPFYSVFFPVGCEVDSWRVS